MKTIITAIMVAFAAVTVHARSVTFGPADEQVSEAAFPMRAGEFLKLQAAGRIHAVDIAAPDPACNPLHHLNLTPYSDGEWTWEVPAAPVICAYTVKAGWGGENDRRSASAVVTVAAFVRGGGNTTPEDDPQCPKESCSDDTCEFTGMGCHPDDPRACPNGTSCRTKPDPKPDTDGGGNGGGDTGGGGGGGGGGPTPDPEPDRDLFEYWDGDGDGDLTCDEAWRGGDRAGLRLPAYRDGRNSTGLIYEWLMRVGSSDTNDDGVACQGRDNYVGYVPAGEPVTPVSALPFLDALWRKLAIW